MKVFQAGLASFRLRILFRTSFLLLALAVLTLAVTVLQEEKQRSYDNYQSGLKKTKEQIVARLHHPAGQLALLNPGWDARAAAAGRPVLLPYAAIDFDDQDKVRNAVDMAGCLVQYKQGASLCVAIGNSPWAGGFLYAAGNFLSGPLAAHAIGDEHLDGAHRLRVTVSLRGQTYRWLAPFEQPAEDALRADGRRGRFTGYVERDQRNYRGARPVREFRGWVWQGGDCVGNEAGSGSGGAIDCSHKSFFSLRLPVDALRDALFQGARPPWPPPDLDQFKVRVEVLPPGDGLALFDSGAPGALPPFGLDDLAALLQPGETLSIRKRGAAAADTLRLTGRDEAPEPSSSLLTRLIGRLPVESLDAPVVVLDDQIATPRGSYQLRLVGDARSVNRNLAAVATRLSWFVGAMLAAIGVAWLVIEIGIVRRITRLTRRTRGLSSTVRGEGGLERFELADLRGGDELGILAAGLDDLLRRVKEDAERERIRAEQEKDMWHAVGHEIMSPLQSLLALHRDANDPSHRYISRMQQAVRILYGNASPSEAIQSSSLQVQALNIAAFVRDVAANAAGAGIANVMCDDGEAAVFARADAYSLEDVFAHILKNADRYRTPGSPIVLSLASTDNSVTINIRNTGPCIPEELIGSIFEYGVSDQPEAGAHGNRGQGLFVAKTYMAKMGGTIAAQNLADGVCFRLELQRVLPRD
jgi:signal transduction histidine kinase